MRMVSPYVYPGLDDKTQLRVKSENNLEVTPETVFEIVSKNCNVTVEEILSKTRVREIAEARQMCCYILRDRYGLPLSRIGKLLNRDHATAIHSVKAHKNRFDVLRDYKELTKKVLSDIDKLKYHSS